MIDRVSGELFSEILHAGCGRGHLCLALAERGYFVVGADANKASIDAARTSAQRRGLITATFVNADITLLGDYHQRFNTVVDDGLLRRLPPGRRTRYLQALHRAAATGAKLFVLDSADGDDTANELRDAVSAVWQIDGMRLLHPSGTSRPTLSLLSAHKC